MRPSPEQGGGWLRPRPLKDGDPCEHKGCLSHITHPCEGCGRIAGKSKPECHCDLRTKLVGDGCSVCNPEYWADMLEDGE